MDASSLVTGGLRTPLPFFRQLDVSLHGFGVVALMAVAMLLAVRRLAGGLAVPLPPPALIGTGLSIATAAAGLRFVPCGHRIASKRMRWLFLIAPTVAVVVASAAISLPESSTAGVSTMWCIVLAIEIASYAAVRLRWRRASSQPVRPSRQRRKKEPEVRFDIAHAGGPPHILAEGLAQQIERGVTDESDEFCHGLLRANFAASQRTETVHVSFCPPFMTVPEFHVEQVDGPDAKVKVAQVLPYGARVEVRLNRAPSESVQTVLEFSAIAHGD